MLSDLLILMIAIISILVLIAASIIATGMLSHQTWGQAQPEPEDIIVNKTTTVDNDTTITITCTENMKGLVESCG